VVKLAIVVEAVKYANSLVVPLPEMLFTIPEVYLIMSTMLPAIVPTVSTTVVPLVAV
jgi:hypothetical protein